MREVHLNQARAEREKFYKHGRKSNMTKSIKENKTWWKYSSVIIDGMTQWTTRLPHFRRMPSYLDRKDFLDVHNMGSIIENVGRFMDFNYANYGDDANFLLNVLHRDVTRIQEHRRKGDGEEPYPMPEVLYVQLDNVGTNKSIMLLAYISWLVMSGAFKKVKVNFLIVGHTHENIDQMFSRFSVRLKRKLAMTLDEMMEIAKECFSDGIFTTAVAKVHDLKTWFGGRYENVCGISTQQTFKAFKNEAGEVVVQYKMYSTDKKWLPEEGLKVLNSMPENLPDFVKPKAFSEEGLTKLEDLVDGMRTILSTTFTPTHEAWWAELLRKQRKLTEEGIFEEPNVPFVLPSKLHARSNAPLVHALEAPLRLAEAQMPAAAEIPARIQERVERAPIAVYTGKRKAVNRAARKAEAYVANPVWEVSFDQMTVNSYAVCFGEITGVKANDVCQFRVKLNGKEWSDPLMLVRVHARIVYAKELKYKYLKVKAYTDTKERRLGKVLAAKAGAFWENASDTPSTEPFKSAEILLAWNIAANEAKGCIPYEQYGQLIVALLAQRAKKRRIDNGQVEETVGDEDNSENEENELDDGSDVEM
ncbi:hypothetical protein CYMTET_55576 [Cymbomonas tetramitiformis]|uniref:DUF7869 domain-containing protein n=1 Tax=Cymbomonas tetramitiformis TaxID=36881 RepID=A0AAE0BEH7_9CHLO|nr:hypothetical protein CYMTET_55576 [Cymbomonas tetramitiformis]